MQHISYVLQDEYDHLINHKEDLERQYKEQSKRKRESCEQWAETRHDNADYEDAEYQQWIISKRIHDVQTTIHNTKILLLDNLWDNKVRIWSTVQLLIDNHEYSYTIWWYPTIPWRVSYRSPLWSALIDQKVWSTITFMHDKKSKIIKILSIR